MKKGFAIMMVVFVFAFVLVLGNAVFFRSDVSANNDSVIRYQTVEIQKGDTLWSIAKEYYEEPCGDIRDYIDQIKECNNLDSSDRITEGCYLCVPVYTENVR
ncbi:MAG TPA: LysM peptidoglycan-binding domain-containing protein [Candidatus Fimousia stercorigallinarum]|nr:LysM peptidoglycan-binding domain-containing protein [Candidatus Fimousia stercorigallinarum]